MQTMPAAEEARDLAEFYQNWPHRRPIMLALCDNQVLSPEQRANLSWLIHLADQVGPQDLVPPTNEFQR